MENFDAIIIGFGKGGKTLAADLAKRGQKVAVIEKSARMYGGTCINIGCIPTKTLVHQAKVASGMKDVPFGAKKEFYRQAILMKESVTDALRNKNYHNLVDYPNIIVYTGVGSFVSSNVVSVKTETGEFRIKSDNIFINTGAETIIPAIKGIEGNPFVYTSTSIMELADLPKKLVIVGGGYIGLEFASMFASFGSEVTVLESYGELIPREDRDIAASVQETLEKRGVVFCMNAKVQTIGHDDCGAAVEYMDSQTGLSVKLYAEAVLLATGRKPQTADLNLATAGIDVDERGAIITDKFLKTTNPHIRAIGDVKGGLQFTYISLDDYRIIREEMFGEKERSTEDREPVSYTVFIDPPLSRIGINEEDARKRDLNVVIKKLPVTSIPRAKTLDETDGMLKVVIDRESNKILGCTLFAPESGEVINQVAMAMKIGLDYTFLRDFIFTHPSMSEALNDLFS